MITTAALEELAREKRAAQPEPYGYCYPTSKAIVRELRKEYGFGEREARIKEVRLGSAGTIRHYVAAVAGSCIEDTEYPGAVLVDATLDQYCIERKEAGDVKVALGERAEISAVNVFLAEEAPYRI